MRSLVDASVSFRVAEAAAWSRDDRWIVFVEQRTVTAIPVDGGDPVQLGGLVPQGHEVLSGG
jgi:hypothetical protein